MSKTRINKFLAEHGYCSRRQADELIKSGKVLFNDKPAKLGDQVGSDDSVRVLGKFKKEKPNLIYIMFNKPVGLICTTDTRKPDNVITFIGHPERIFPVGRLDVQSSGLLLLTNDGELANRLMHPRYQHEREYVVEVDQPIKRIDIGRLQSGIHLKDGITQETKVRQLKPDKFAIILKEGRNRQIRRMCEKLGYEIKSLKRTRIGKLKMQNLPDGYFRDLTKQEVEALTKQKSRKK